MTSQSETHWAARTAYGVTIRDRFASRAEALTWWAQRSVEFPGGMLEEVTTETRVTRRTVRRARAVAA